MKYLLVVVLIIFEVSTRVHSTEHIETDRKSDVTLCHLRVLQAAMEIDKEIGQEFGRVTYHAKDSDRDRFTEQIFGKYEKK